MSFDRNQVGYLPTQAKTRLEWATQRRLPIRIDVRCRYTQDWRPGRVSVVPAGLILLGTVPSTACWAIFNRPFGTDPDTRSVFSSTSGRRNVSAELARGQLCALDPRLDLAKGSI